jgi:hypothetical protein
VSVRPVSVEPARKAQPPRYGSGERDGRSPVYERADQMEVVTAGAIANSDLVATGGKLHHPAFWILRHPDLRARTDLRVEKGNEACSSGRERGSCKCEQEQDARDCDDGEAVPATDDERAHVHGDPVEAAKTAASTEESLRDDDREA